MTNIYTYIIEKLKLNKSSKMFACYLIYNFVDRRYEPYDTFNEIEDIIKHNSHDYEYQNSDKKTREIIYHEFLSEDDRQKFIEYNDELVNCLKDNKNISADKIIELAKKINSISTGHIVEI